jgi:hypothetical protein
VATKWKKVSITRRRVNPLLGANWIIRWSIYIKKSRFHWVKRKNHEANNPKLANRIQGSELKKNSSQNQTNWESKFQYDKHVQLSGIESLSVESIHSSKEKWNSTRATRTRVGRQLSPTASNHGAFLFSLSPLSICSQDSASSGGWWK